MTTVLIDLNNRRRVRDFVDLPFRLYAGVPQWVPALEMEMGAVLAPHAHPFYRHSEAAFFIAYRDNLPVGRIAVLDNRRYNEYNREKTAFFYWFECEDNERTAASLLTAAGDWARMRGLEQLFGPKGFTALDGLGLLVKGFERRPALGLPYNLPYYSTLLETQGFEKAGEIVSGYLGVETHFPERIHALAARIQERRGLHIARFRTRWELRRMLPRLKELYNGALDGTPGNVPLTDEEVAALAGQILWLADPRLIKIVMKGDRAVGFLFAYPDITAAIQKTRGRLFPFGWLVLLRALRSTDWININGAGLVEEYRGLGGTAVLYSELFKAVAENPRYRHAEVVQIGMENEAMQREMENFGIEFYKVHRTYRIGL
ncbi:MAG: hypothetical protein JXB85_15960 [Anaerolineales bacterium]|nr:hypothetical protein [Anaerolineales bacterium]